MIIDDHLASLESEFGDEDFLRPDYKCFSFAQIPSLIEALLGAGEGDAHPWSKIVLERINNRPQNVVLLMIDGFAYQSWMKYGERYPFLSHILDKGFLLPITALFPSTTAASVTTINSGLTPQEHGLLEWHLYLEELGEVITTLPFKSLWKGAVNDELLERGVDPHVLFNGKSIHARLADRGISSYAMLHGAYANSAYSKVIQEGAEVVPASSFSDMVVSLRQRLNDAKGKSYFYVYWDDIDHMSHIYGPHGECYLAALNGFTHLLKTELLDQIDRSVAENTVLLVTADHGHVVMKPDETVYLNQWPEVEGALAKNPAGRVIYPWGNRRDVFLQVVDDKVDEIIGFLAEKLAGKARVVKAQEEADKGLFGEGEEHPQFRKRIGNVLILPYEEYTVWYQYPEHEKSKHRGMHGGLSREEMLTVLGFANLGDLI